MTTLLEMREEIYESLLHIPNDGWCRITDEDQAKVLYKAIDESEEQYRFMNPFGEWDDIGHNKFHRKELEMHGYYIVRWYKRIDKSSFIPFSIASYLGNQAKPIERAEEVIFKNHFKLKYEHRGKNQKKFGI